jgi:hypothetical protein
VVFSGLSEKKGLAKTKHINMHAGGMAGRKGKGWKETWAVQAGIAFPCEVRLAIVEKREKHAASVV